jgi:uncharacterized MAPEG superfamily protein
MKRRGLDHNVDPRQDLGARADAVVSKGKLSRRELDRLRRWQAAHENAMENFPAYVAAIISAYLAGVPYATLNGLSVWYTASRVVHTFVYVLVETESWSYVRSLCWWSGNISCMTALGLAARVELYSASRES